jgi:hypothetical protein
MMNNNSEKSLMSILLQVVNSIYLVAPELVIVGIFLGTIIISITLLSSTLMTGSLVLLVFLPQY